MVDFTAAEIREVMDKRSNIRNISVIGHFNHGKSTLTSCLVAAAGTMRQEGSVEPHVTDTLANEVDSSIRSTGISLLYKMNSNSLEAYKGERNGDKYLINLIDSPGHVDFCAEAKAALHITDGALLVINSFEGVCVQTETLLRDAINERVRPVLCLNMMDTLFSGLQVGGANPRFTGEQVYQILSNVVENSNAIMEACDSNDEVNPQNGTVAFSSCLHGWAFTITGLARKYALLSGGDESKFAERLWGDHFFDSTKKMWTNKHNGSAKCHRGFVHLFYNPVTEIMKACMNEDKGNLWDICQKLGISLTADEKKLLGEDLFNCTMRSWLPASTTFFEMIIFHLPSPLEAQEYRVENLYEGPPDDTYAEAIRNCDREGPLMVCVSKMIPTSDASRLFAFGRVFSGQIADGMKVRIMGPSYVPGMKKDLYVKQVLRTVIWMGKNEHAIDDVPCGNTVGLIGFDECITKGATLTGEMEVEACPIRAMKLALPHFLYVQVKARIPSNAHLLRDGLRRLTKCDLAVMCCSAESGSFRVAGIGELHLAVCLKNLEGMMNGVELTVSSPIVLHCETVLDKFGSPMEIISGNKHNNISILARSLPDELVEAIDNGLLSPYVARAVRSEIFLKYGWNEQKIWCFGPEAIGPNMVVDMCKTQCPELVKKSIVAGFKLASKEGALAKEKMRGICFEVHDINIDPKDAAREKSPQIDEMVARALFDSQLAAKPRLLEPVYTVVMQCPESALSAVNGILKQRGAFVHEHFETEETMLFNLRAYVSVYDSFGLAKAIKAATSGQVTPHFIFGYWDDMSCSPIHASTPAGKRVLEIRQMKNMEKPSFQK